MVNDDLPNRILSDGTVEDDIDLVVFATGYTFSFPFLSSHVIPVSKNKVSLYKYVYPPALEHPTLAVIGLIQPLGAIMPISEMQARWATRVFKGIKHSADLLHRKLRAVLKIYVQNNKNVYLCYYSKFLSPKNIVM